MPAAQYAIRAGVPFVEPAHPGVLPTFTQGQFHVYWQRGQTNKADYPSKHHPVSHHRKMRPTYLYSPRSVKYNPERDTNYYSVLDETEDAQQAAHTSSCEGVLKSSPNPARNNARKASTYLAIAAEGVRQARDRYLSHGKRVLSILT